MKVIILAAGYATRLEPLTLTTPKPLLPIAGKSIMERIISKIHGLKDRPSAIYAITNAKFFEKFREWLKMSGHCERISIIDDGTTTNETRLGAIRDMELAINDKKIDDDILVVAGDNLFDVDLNDFLEFAKTKDGVSIALHDIKDKALAKSFGVVKVDAGAKVVDFAEKPENPASSLVSTGIYYFPKSKVRLIKEYLALNNKSDAPGYYIGWLSKNDKVYGFAFQEDWYDIGSIESYRKADKEYTDKEK